MIEFIEKLNEIFPTHEFKDTDIEILENCIIGYNENDIIWACRKLFEDKKCKGIKPFENKEIFIKYRNLHREFFPNWLDNLTADDQYDLKENYKIIVKYCFLDHEQYNCNYPDILELIQEYHKQGIPYWCISAYIQEIINLKDNIYYINKSQLLEVMNKSEVFKNGCREIFKRQKKFKESLSRQGINFIESIGKIA